MMRRHRNRYTGYLVPVLAIAGMLLLLILTLLRLTAVQQAMRSDDQANMTWVLSQTHIKSLQLLNLAQRHDATEASQHALVRHQQLLLSRLQLLNDGPQRRFLAQINADGILLSHTEALRALYQDGTPDNNRPELLKQLVDRLNVFHEQLQDISRQAMIQQWEDAGRELDSYRNTVLTAITLLVGILLCSLFISAKLLLTLRAARETHASRLHSLELEARLASERRASELYRHFAGMMSHQFRTPLAIMDASLQRLLRAREPLSRAELSRRIGKARNAISRLTAVLDTLLDIPRSADSETHTPPTAQSLAAIASQAIAIQQAATPQAQLILQTPHGEDILALCNAGLTEQILLNLLSNAVKYGPSHAPITLRVYRCGEQACCSVADTGGRIDNHELPRLFERSYRGQQAAGAAGQGLGLSVAQQLAQLQAGQIEVHIEPGQRTEFILSLPTASDQAPTLATESNAA